MFSKTSKLFPLIYIGNSILRQRAVPCTISEISDNYTQKLIKELKNQCIKQGAVGLAAPQLSVSKRIFVIRNKWTSEMPLLPEIPLTVLINPVITTSGENRNSWEGCLSIPGYFGSVPRKTSVVVNYLNEEGKEMQMEATDSIASIIQHEHDHLEGILYLDRMENRSDIVFENEFFKFYAHSLKETEKGTFNFLNLYSQ
eukprot:TRINITY_DN5486_c0_g1_i1.p1 TRINITY_DN5486_c0_g1~~TRINITY_DN5486_c0_g1_i1.p1  ORF type:complete len:199 (-),score=25.94 TRINITY_DN5486_c0_g1_i1:24-620(-)